jgi:nicotinate-nucleotide adenylyltransferase
MGQATGSSERATLIGSSRIAFFGGSFDPPHEGHLAIARAAKLALHLDTVLFAPVGTQPLKPEGSTAPFEDRVAMTRLAVERDSGFAVSLVDAPKSDGAPNFTLDTLFQLTAALPPGGSLFFLMGSDSFFGLRRWHRAAEIPFVAPLIVASRPGQPLDDLMSALPVGLSMEPLGADSHSLAVAETLPGLRSFMLTNSSGAKAPLYLLTGLDFDVSASHVREQIRAGGVAGRAGRLPVPTAVMDYIRARALYK